MEFSQIEKALRQRMEERSLSALFINDFIRRVRLVHEGSSGKIPWQNISDLNEDDFVRPEEFFSLNDSLPYLKKAAIIKLNGGLGTSMGLNRAKSLLEARDGHNFLQIIRKQVESARQRYQIELPLLFMNSFVTHEDTLSEAGIAALNSHLNPALSVDFLQNSVPRLDNSSLLPYGSGKAKDDWCPPGHGDIYMALSENGLLDQLLDAGYTTAFISNGDNLGAIIEPQILAYFITNQLEFLSEVTPKTRADIKGGVLFRSPASAKHESRIDLLEVAQVEDEHRTDFEDIDRFSSFNINNLWINLESLRDRCQGQALELPIICNRKKVNGDEVLQLESAMGAAIGLFDRTRVIQVSRNRFAPVKNCSDLLALRSDYYQLDPESFSVTVTPEREPGELVVSLDENYSTIRHFEELCPVIPSLRQATQLEVRGPVIFDKKIEIIGQVTIVNESSEPQPLSRISQDSFQDEEVRLD